MHNPEGVLYGRRDGFHLSDLGRRMAQRVADAIGDRDIVHLVASPLERAQETAGPLAAARGLDVATDERIIESTNVFEGRTFADPGRVLRDPSVWRHLWNPFQPSWGEPYADVAARMRAAVLDARREARGPRGCAGLPPAADLDDAALGGGAARSSTTRGAASARCAR